VLFRSGLIVYAATMRVLLNPDQGPVQGHKIAQALLSATGTYDATRSDLDEADVAVRVLEHMRPLDGRGLSDLRRGDLDRLAMRADAVRGRAPFNPPVPEARSSRERTLRRYLAAYGIESPPRTEPDRHQAGLVLPDALQQISRHKPKASVVHVIAPSPNEVAHEKPLSESLRRLARHGVSIHWSIPQFEAALLPPWEPPKRADGSAIFSEASDEAAWEGNASIAAQAVLVRTRVSVARSEAALRRMGVRITRLRTTTPRRPDVPGDSSTP